VAADPRRAKSAAPAVAASAQRKAEHLRFAARPDALHSGATGLDAIRLRHRALPERSLEEVSTGTSFLGRELGVPLLVSAMTGGAAESSVVNTRLMAAAASVGAAWSWGSGRQLLRDNDLVDTYVKAAGPERPPIVMANLGATPVREHDGPERAERLVELLGADALFVHLNPLQEAIQPGGETDFSGVLDAIGRLVERLFPIPIGVKEVGFGLASEDVVALRGVGVAVVDVAAAGGTNWALIEGMRSGDSGRLAAAFDSWGTPTVDALLAARRALGTEFPIVASGGLRDGVDVAKCLVLGADLAGFARPALLAAQANTASEWLANVARQLQIATWLVGAASVRDLDAGALATAGP
jgi:isopentenyl-diphosphate delta-isomerase